MTAIANHNPIPLSPRNRPNDWQTLHAANSKEAQAKKDEAIAISSERIYERFRKYLTGCADLFRQGYTDVCQFTCEKA